MAKRFSLTHVAVLVMLTTLVATAAASLYQVRAANEKSIARAVDSARALARLADEAGSAYAHSLGAAIRTGLLPAAPGVAPDFAAMHLPVTFLRQLAGTVERHDPDTALRIYSNFPDATRRGQRLDRFQRASLVALSRAPGGDYWRAEYVGGGRVQVRYASPLPLDATCTACHGGPLPDTRPQQRQLALREVSITLPENALSAAPGRPAVFALLVLSIFTVIFVLFPAIRRDTRQREVLGTMNEKLSQDAEKLARDALTDPLTLLLNRRGFETLLEQYTRQHAAVAKRLGLILLDIDHFKSINDTYGHGAGDTVIGCLGVILSDNIRPEDHAARIGGEEFAILSPGAGLSDLTNMAQRIRKTIARTDIPVCETEIRVTASVGVAVLASDETPDDCLRRADALLYRAKDEGRNRVMVEPLEDVMAGLELSDPGVGDPTAPP